MSEPHSSASTPEAPVACISCGHENRENAKFCDSCGAPLAEKPSAPAAAEAQHAQPLPASFAAGRYEVKGFLGEGGRKLVYLARDTKLDRDVAIAVIKTDGLDETGLTRVRREAQAMARLSDHAHIVTVHDIGEDGAPDGRTQPYIVSQYMAGGDIESLLRTAPDQQLALEEAVRIAGEVCEALEYAHSRGIIHRDLKPGNIWLAKDGTAKLGDFGLAVALEDSRLTLEGMMVGTVSYMPPEQALGGQPGARADIYSLGCVLYEMVTGRPPFLGDDALGVISQHINTAPIAPSWHNPSVPRALEALILRTLEKDPGQRPASAAEVGEALSSIDLAQASTATREQPGAANPMYRRTFVGRDAELRRLEAAFDGAISGSGNLIMVVGEPGIGKTSVCEQLSTYVSLRGGRTLVGHCYEEGSLSLPYLPFVEALRSYVMDREQSDLKRELGSGAAEVARIVSEVRDRLEVEAGPQLDPAEERYRLLQAVTGFLRSASVAQPILIVLEDLHDADRGTLDMLTHLARNLAGARLLIVGTYRDVEVDRTHPLSGALVELRRGVQFDRVLLRGLNADEVRRMLSAIAGQEVQWGLAEAVHRQTEGNPLFVQEVTRYLAEEGLVKQTDDRWRSTTEQLALSIPEGLRDVIGKRLSRLSPECNRLLAIAAVAGREFALETLRAVAGLPEDDLLVALEEAVRVGVLEERSRAGDVRYRFAHAFFRQSLYEELIAPRRIRLHQQVAIALQEQYATRLEEHGAELAEHFSYSSDPADLGNAVRYAEMAAARALSVYAHAEAAALLKKALEIQEVLNPDDQAKRFDLLLAQSSPRHDAADMDEARRLLFEAAAIARKLGDSERLISAACAGADMMWIGGMADEPMARLIEEALAAVGDREDSSRVWLLSRMAALAASSGRREDGERLATEALELARRIGDEKALWAALRSYLFTTTTQPRHLPERRALVDEIGALGEKAGLIQAQVLAHLARSGMALMTGDLPEAKGHLDLLGQLAHQHNLHLFQEADAHWHGELCRITGDFEEAERLFRSARETWAPNWKQLDELRGAAGGGLVMLREQQGRLGEVEEDQLEALAAVREMGLEWRQQSARAIRLYAMLGRRGECADEFERFAATGFSEIDNHPQPAYLVACLSEACAFLEDQASAALLYPQVAPFAGYNLMLRLTTSLWFGPADRNLGVLAALLERWDDAERHLQDAMAMCEKVPSPPYLAQTQYDYARMLLRRGGSGDRPRALELLGKAGQAAQRMGMAGLARQVVAAKAEAQGISSQDIRTSIEAVAASVERERPDLASHAAPDGTVTIMFSDIEDSTPLTERLGDERFMDVLREHNAIVRDQIRAHDGFEVKNEGDGFMVAFQSAGKAIACASAIQQALVERNQSADEPVLVRMGLHAGEVIKEGADFFGRNVIMAARVASQANGGEILASGVLKALVDGSDVSWGEKRTVKLKGLSGAHEIWAVIWQDNIV
jgi:class 3 adenylate cyclase